MKYSTKTKGVNKEKNIYKTPKAELDAFSIFGKLYDLKSRRLFKKNNIIYDLL